MDDPGYSPAALPPILSADPNVAAAQGLGYYDTGAQTSPVVAPYLAKLTNAYATGQLTPGRPVGPGGRDPTSGLAYAWTPYDPAQQLFDSHQHFGPTYDDPILGKLQSMYTEPSKSAHDFWQGGGLAKTLFGVALSAIAGGAGAPLLGTLFSGATNYGMTGSLDPKALALSAAMSMVPGALGGIDPALAQAYRVAGAGYGAGRAGYEASRGNYVPAGVSLGRIAAGG